MTDLTQCDVNTPRSTQVIANALVERPGPRQNASDADQLGLPRPTQVIAKALVERHGPRQIALDADQLGFPRSLTRVIMAACCSTAVDRGSLSRKRSTLQS